MWNKHVSAMTYRRRYFFHFYFFSSSESFSEKLRELFIYESFEDNVWNAHSSFSTPSYSIGARAKMFEKFHECAKNFSTEINHVTNNFRVDFISILASLLHVFLPFIYFSNRRTRLIFIHKLLFRGFEIFIHFFKCHLILWIMNQFN